MRAFGEFKSVWDPGNKMNPHKVVDAYLPTENLRLGADYKPLDPAHPFPVSGRRRFLRQGQLRCLGLGECRKNDTGSMCPSYMVTLEEEHSTRGRAHMLFELLQGEVVRDGWKNEHVKKALDLCLSCKACKSECPTNVDIATYRAEFLSHYYEGRSRPLNAYAFGMIDRWARLASLAPGLANFSSNAPGVQPVAAKRAAPRAATAATSVCTIQFSTLGQKTASVLPRAEQSIRPDDRQGRTRSHFVGGYVQQLFSSGNEPSRA